MGKPIPGLKTAFRAEVQPAGRLFFCSRDGHRLLPGLLLFTPPDLINMKALIFMKWAKHQKISALLPKIEFGDNERRKISFLEAKLCIR
jgi:hypothetical protein